MEEYQSTRDFSPRESNFEMLNGFPMVFYANQYFKNFRGAVVADINDDGVQEIVTGSDEIVYAINGSGEIIWESENLPGNITYPPAVADVDGDGLMEIAVNTNYTNNYWDGSVCLFDHEGTMVDRWPVSFDNHTMTCAPAIADIDEDGTMEIISFKRKTGSGDIEAGVYVFTPSGASFSDDWPVIRPGTPAVTPSVGDVDADGSNDIVVQNHPEKGNISYQHRIGCKVVSSGFLNFSKIIRGSVIFLKRKAYG